MASPPELPPGREGRRADEDAELRAAMQIYALANPGPGRDALKKFLAKHPAPPQAALAAALLARLALDEGDTASARSILNAHAANSGDAVVRFMRGLIETRLGHGAKALELLQPFATSGPPPFGIETDEAGLALHAALAEAHLGAGDPVAALGQWNAYVHQDGAREIEKTYARDRADEIAARLTDDQAASAYRIGGDLVRAAVGPRAATLARARGDADEGRRIDDESASLRRSYGWTEAPGGAGPGDPHRLGLLAPLSGNASLLGEVVLRGAMLAIGQAATPGEPGPFQLVVRDDAPEHDPAQRAALELSRDESALGLVGVGDRRAAEPAVRDGVPVLLLDETAPGAGSTAFQILHTPELRAAELARRALSLGARRFALLAPDSPAGHRLSDAFVKAASAGGGHVVAQASYPPAASGFTGPIAQLRRQTFEAIFVADDAKRLELIAPALAAADLWSQPWSAAMTAPPPPPEPGAPVKRPVLLLSTSVGLSPQLLRNAGRYVQGALLAPGFFSDPDDPRAGTFIAQYRTLYGQDPGAADAYGYDAFRLMTTAVERGAHSRAELLRALGAPQFQGVTGSVQFGPDHARIDAPPVYMVDGDAIRALR